MDCRDSIDAVTISVKYTLQLGHQHGRKTVQHTLLFYPTQFDWDILFEQNHWTPWDFPIGTYGKQVMQYWVLRQQIASNCCKYDVASISTT